MNEGQNAVEEEPPRELQELAPDGQGEARSVRAHRVAEDDSSELPDNDAAHERPIVTEKNRQRHGESE